MTFYNIIFEMSSILKIFSILNNTFKIYLDIFVFRKYAYYHNRRT